MCLNKIFSRVRVGRLLSDMFLVRNVLKQGQVLSPLLFNFVFEYAIRRDQVNLDGWKLSGSYQLLIYADYVNILGGNVHTVKEKSEALSFVSKKTGLEVNADKTKYVFMSRHQNAERSNSIKMDSSTFERVYHLKFL